MDYWTVEALDNLADFAVELGTDFGIATAIVPVFRNCHVAQVVQELQKDSIGLMNIH